MPEYLSPGVYIEETSFRGKPIEGVSTSTAGFVGRARAGDEGRPTLVTSFAQFRREFGEPFSNPSGLGDYLGHGVRAFFENGGRRVYVVRALASDALAANELAGLGTVLRLSAGITVRGPASTIPLNSVRNLSGTSTLHVFTRPNPTAPFAAAGTHAITSFDPVRKTVELGVGIGPGVTWDPQHTFFLVQGVAPQTGAVAGPTFEARNRGAAGNALRVEMRPVDRPPVRLSTCTGLRARPVVDTAVAAALTTAPLSAAGMMALRSGDTIAVGTEETLLSAIDDATVNLDAAGTAADYRNADAFLVQRGAFAAPAPIPLGVVGNDASLDMTPLPAAGSDVVIAHDVAGYLQAGDLVRLDDGGGNSVDLTINAVTPGVSITYNAISAPLAAAEIRLVSTSNTVATIARVVVGDAACFAAPYRESSVEPVVVSDGGTLAEAELLLADAVSGTLLLSKPPGEFGTSVAPDSWTTVETRQVAADGDTIMRVAAVAGFYSGAIIAIDDGGTQTDHVVASLDPASRTITLTAPLNLGGPGNFIDVPTDPAERRAYARTLEFDFFVYDGDVIVETFPGLSWNPDPVASSYSRYFMARLNDPEIGSNHVELSIAAPPPLTASGQPTTNNGFPLALKGGDDGSALTEIDLMGADNGPGQRTGIEALKERDDISIVAVPGVTLENVQAALVSHAERMRYRFAVLDGEPGVSDVTDIQSHRNNYDSKYAAYYTPWLKTIDLTTGQTLIAPPSGYVSGIYARSDNERGVHKAPANEVVRNINDVQLPFTQGEQDVLNPVGVNLVREFTGRGIRVWGARTISSDAEWKYVNVRRLFIFLEHSIDRGTQWVVFEPNNELLWSRVVETVTAFLTGVWKTGALLGTTPDEAFFVRCDRTTMTQDDIDNGRLVCLIGVAPTKPAEFVIFRIGQFTASSAS